MKTTSLRIGNKLLRTEGQILTVSHINMTDDILVKEEFGLFTFGYTANPIPLDENWFEKLGLKKYNGVLPAYELRIEAHGFYKAISLQYNNDNATKQYYVWFREGDIEKEREEDSIVCLRKDLQYVHELQNLFFAITGNELIDLDEMEIKKEPYLEK